MDCPSLAHSIPESLSLITASHHCAGHLCFISSSLQCQFSPYLFQLIMFTTDCLSPSLTGWGSTGNPLIIGSAYVVSYFWSPSGQSLWLGQILNSSQEIELEPIFLFEMQMTCTFFLFVSIFGEFEKHSSEVDKLFSFRSFSHKSPIYFLIFAYFSFVFILLTFFVIFPFSLLSIVQVRWSFQL